MTASVAETEKRESPTQLGSSRFDIFPEDSSRENFDAVDSAKDKDTDQIDSAKDSSIEGKDLQNEIPSSEDKAEKQSPATENRPAINSEKVLSAELTVEDVGEAFEEFNLEYPNTGYSFSERDGKIDLEKNGRFVGQDIEAFMDASGYYAAVNKAANEGRGVWKSFDEENQTMYVAIITRQENDTVSWNTYKREIKKTEAEEDKEKEETQLRVEMEEQLEQPVNTPPILVNSEPSINNGVHTPKNISEFWNTLQSREDEQSVIRSETQPEEILSIEQENFSTENNLQSDEALKATIPDQQKFESISLGLEIATVDNSDSAENGPQKSVEETTTNPGHSAFEELLSIDLSVEVADSSSANDSTADTFSAIETVESATTTTAAEIPTINTEVPATTEASANTTVEAQNITTIEKAPIDTETSAVPINKTAEVIETSSEAHTEIGTTVEAQNISSRETEPNQQNSFMEQSQAGANEVFDHLYEQAQRSAADFNESHQVQSEKAKDLLEEVVDSSTSVDGFYGQQATEQRDANKAAEKVASGHQEIEDLDIPFENNHLTSTNTEQRTDSATSNNQTTNANQTETLRVQSLGVENSMDNTSTFSEDGPDSTPPQNGEVQRDASDEKSVTVELQKPDTFDLEDIETDLDRQQESPEGPANDDGPEVTHIIEQPVGHFAKQTTEQIIKPTEPVTDSNVEQIIKSATIESASKENPLAIEHATETTPEQSTSSNAEVAKSVETQNLSEPAEKTSHDDIKNISTEHSTTENIEVQPLDVFQEFNQRTAETTGISLVEAPRSNQTSAASEAATEISSLNPQAARHIASTVQYVQQSDSSSTNKPAVTTTAPMTTTINQSS